MQEFKVPSSKSISNRLLIIQYLSETKAKINNLSTAQDTILLQNLLNQIETNPLNTFHCQNAGTVTRFLIGLLALKEGSWEIDGDKRMRERPIKPLLEALQTLGAEITYLSKPHHLPLRIIGGKLKKDKHIEIDTTISSQHLSSLLLISPYIKGITLSTNNNSVSQPYIEMTLALMQEHGAKLKQIKNKITILHSPYTFKECQVESDWSSVCFAYEKLCIMQKGELYIKGLMPNSLQADKIAQKYYLSLGIESLFKDNNLIITYNPKAVSQQKHLVFNIQNNPDIFPCLAVAGLLSGKKISFEGISNLKYKESNRIEAVHNGIKTLGADVKISQNTFTIEPFNKQNDLLENSNHLIIKTYNDHRIAMAFGLLSLKYPQIKVDDNACVNKSFPNFWENIQ
jgi:3-phosphoshikimate 1-carboxyvinyltransferase